VSTAKAVESTTVVSTAVESEVEVDVPALFEQAVNVATATIAIAKITFFIFCFWFLFVF
jgi:hypothetical protein